MQCITDAPTAASIGTCHPDALGLFFARGVPNGSFNGLGQRSPPATRAGKPRLVDLTAYAPAQHGAAAPHDNHRVRLIGGFDDVGEFPAPIGGPRRMEELHSHIGPFCGDRYANVIVISLLFCGATSVTDVSTRPSTHRSKEGVATGDTIAVDAQSLGSRPCKRPEEREFYLRQSIREGWPKRDLERQTVNSASLCPSSRSWRPYRTRGSASDSSAPSRSPSAVRPYQ